MNTETPATSGTPATSKLTVTPTMRATLLAVSTLTIMAGATIAPGLPRMQTHFASVPDAGLLVRLVLTIVALSVALFSPVAGIIADRIGRKPLLLFGLVLYAVAGTSGLYLETLPALLTGRVLLGIAVAAIATASGALIADSFQGAARARFISLQSAFTSFGGVIFLPLGGALADLDWHAPFAVYFASLIALPFAYFSLTEPARAEVTERKTKAAMPRLIWVLYLLAFVSMIVFYLGPTQIPFLLQNVIGLKPSLSGYVVAFLTLSSAITALQYSRLRSRLTERTLAVIGFGLLGAGWLLLGIPKELWLILLGLMVSGAGIGILGPNFGSWLANLAPPEARGRVLGGLSTAIFTGQFVSPILAQPVVNGWGLSSVFAFGAGLALFTAGIAYVALQKSTDQLGD